MENEEMNNSKQPGSDNPAINNAREEYMHNFRKSYYHNNWLGGIVIILVGVVLLLRQIPQTAIFFPPWLFDWPMILIAIGVFIGARHNFRSGGWFVPILIGIFFLLRDNQLISERWENYIWPLFLIFFGFVFLIRRKNYNDRFYGRCNHRFDERMKRRQEFWQQREQRFKERFTQYSRVTENSNVDFVDINSIFGSSEKTLFTKAFKGGNISATFGGAELNLSQCDIEETAVLNISVTFGGVEITVPANWTIQNELNSIMGGIEDKRRMSIDTTPPKILILRGGVSCGGVEIKN